MAATDSPGEHLAAVASGIGALADPARRALYGYVASAREPVSREQAATGCDLPVHSARFHLDRLVDEGLLEVEYKRLTGRTGPGAGRPAKLYRRAEREVSLSLPARHYEVVGRVLAAAADRTLQTGTPLAESLTGCARAAGGQLGADLVGDLPGDGAARVEVALEACGYEPHPDGAELALANCPFDALAREHTSLVCGLNLDLLGGLLDVLEVGDREAVLAPRPGLCCVRVRPRGPSVDRPAEG
ncbi:MAG TPA: helix-turn-helix domain-containing protein [Nocardioidaceae bacterium]|jgi:predicted ArsR family transcriptional regulator|nr:helix-turn-helix domain-containing protein [Nocardioidaceae bacterium]